LGNSKGGDFNPAEAASRPVGGSGGNCRKLKLIYLN